MMRVTLINGLNGDTAGFETALDGMIKNNDSIHFEKFNVRDMNIGYCCGCWGCWVKTPGECAIKDDDVNILESVIHSDLTVFVSPVVMGFVSSHIKKVTDRLIPLVHPYIGIHKGECHHRERYEKRPRLGLVLVDENIGGKDGIDMIRETYERISINLRTDLAFSVCSSGDTEVLVNEIERF